MLDLRTLWLAWPEDRYEARPALRQAERAVYALLRSWAKGSRSGTLPPGRVVAGDRRAEESSIEA